MKGFFIFCLLLVGCGYTTRGFVYNEKSIYISPVVNKVNITEETRAYSSYVSYPILLEKRLTNSLINKFSIESSLKVASTSQDSLNLECQILNYTKEPLRYSNDDRVSEQRLRLVIHFILRDKDGNLLKEKDIIGETTYFLSGVNAKSESEAWTDLIEDTARRIVEAVVEKW